MNDFFENTENSNESGVVLQDKVEMAKKKKMLEKDLQVHKQNTKKVKNIENAMKPSIMAKEKDSEESGNSSLSDASDLKHVYQRRESHPYSSGGKSLESPVKEKRATIE